MHLDRDEFVVTYDPAVATVDEIIAFIKEAGYTSCVATGPVSAIAVQVTVRATADPLIAAALTRAKTQNQPIILDFHASWCVPCRRIENETFNDPQVAALLKRCILLKIDTDERPTLARSFGVHGLPDIRFLFPDGTEHRRLLGFRDASSFAQEVEALLEAIMDHDQNSMPQPSAATTAPVPENQ
jgi:thiol:disulfide interchange protein